VKYYIISAESGRKIAGPFDDRKEAAALLKDYKTMTPKAKPQLVKA
jgi:hypothetical protein